MTKMNRIDTLFRIFDVVRSSVTKLAFMNVPLLFPILSSSSTMLPIYKRSLIMRGHRRRSERYFPIRSLILPSLAQYI